MAQKSLRSQSKQKSAGALRKYVGSAKRKSTFTKKRNTPEAKAQANYIQAVEAAMTSRAPSDLRAKLTVVKPGTSAGAAAASTSKKKHMKKPLTRGRKRKN